MQTRIELDFDGFLPNEKEVSVLKHKFDELQLRLPSDANIHSTIQKELPSSYIGRVSVASRGRKFIIKASANQLPKLIAQLESGVRRQIVQWRKNQTHYM